MSQGPLLVPCLPFVPCPSVLELFVFFVPFVRLATFV